MKKILVFIIAPLFTQYCFAQINPLSIGTIHANDSVVVVYDVTIANPLPVGTGVVRIGNQATLSGSNFANIVTDDPDTPAPLDSTYTPILNLLPVTLIDFNAMKQKTEVMLQWRTSQELNSDHFEVQHSIDGITFRALGNVRAAGSSNTPRDYSFLHATPVKGFNYYRLKQYDLDGRGVVYYIRAVRFDGNEVQEIYIYPNPVTQGTINVQLSNVEIGNYNLMLYNAAGEIVSQQKISYNGDGAPVTVSVPKTLSSGVYSLQLQNGSFKISRMIVVQ